MRTKRNRSTPVHQHFDEIITSRLHPEAQMHVWAFQEHQPKFSLLNFTTSFPPPPGTPGHHLASASAPNSKTQTPSSLLFLNQSKTAQQNRSKPPLNTSSLL
ncbi:Uncharacterized protein Adt_24568 [Abeliophyllum distichum]|uniref:Uncharacterized protein n=1 Tax=Abeliophyllum distichum TaxID=126358 RepID=A0ABD1SF64_9LAMI